MHARHLIILAAFMLVFFSAVRIEARPEYAARTSQDCAACHLSPQGGALSAKGLDFAASGYVWPPEKSGYRALTPIKRSVRLFVGFLHMLAAFMWFGTILYVHILLRPGYASKGLPKGEVILGLVSMTAVGVTGVLLTVSRINDVSVLLETRWGHILLVKILLYLVMIASAATVVTVVGPRLRRSVRRAVMPRDGVFGPETLSRFDGQDGRPALVAFKGKVYDFSALRLWKGGAHMRLHSAGTDLTSAIARAPHGEEKLTGLEIVGEYDPAGRPPRTPAQKAFYAIAYSNLLLVFCVLFVIALWRWGG